MLLFIVLFSATSLRILLALAIARTGSFVLPKRVMLGQEVIGVW
jgi:hypothetical protein